MVRLGAIDVGTNSVKLVVADAQDDGSLVVVGEDSEITRLGKAVDRDHRLAGESIERTLGALGRFKDLLNELKVERVGAVGTSVLRDAQNGKDFLESARTRFGLDIEIISGDREAQLAYKAVAGDPDLNIDPSNKVIVFDIGGGSTEMVLGLGLDVIESKSLDIGAVRLTERFLHSDPPTQSEYQQAKSLAMAQVGLVAYPGVTEAIGIGGTIVNVARVVSPTATDVHASTLTIGQIRDAARLLLSVPVKDRKLTPGLDPARADVILGGVAILDGILETLLLPACRVSTRGVRFGLLFELAAG